MKPIAPLDLDVVRELIDFQGGRVSRAVADEQERGATAIHNILARRGYAYLADEVGMGKTYIALGVIGLMRFFHPDLRVLIITPRNNIQSKWEKEFGNFVRHNWRFVDQRVRSFEDRPAVPVIRPGSLVEWARECVSDPSRDVILRMTSFAWALDDPDKIDRWREQQHRVEGLAPLLEGHFPARLDRDKDKFKARAALAVNTLLPHYDLVVIDESHHFKQGRDSTAARNKMLAITLGSHTPKEMKIDVEEGAHFGRRFDRLLCLSATPVEKDFQQLFNQLDLLGFGGEDLAVLSDRRAEDAAKRAVAERFLVRRLTSLSIAGDRWTRNMYRREWRAGGMREFDAPMQIPGDRQRLIVALIQRKLASLLNRGTLGRAFQIGMLASFESFEESVRGRAKEDPEPKSSEPLASDAPSGASAEPIFDDAEQTDDPDQRRGVDRLMVARIADSYRERFGAPLPHPKMDAVVANLAHAFARADKALVFVRRVKSVPELVLKLGDAYDEWLQDYLRGALPPTLHPAMDAVWAEYRAERRRDITVGGLNDAAESGDGNDTFFSWFFQSQTDRGALLTGAKFRENRLMKASSALSTFFEDNYVAAMFDFPADLLVTLTRELSLSADALREELRERASQRLSTWTRPGRLHIHQAVQEAALRLLADSPSRRAQEAREMADVLYGGPPSTPQQERLHAFDVDTYLGVTTFFTELRRRTTLRAELWPVEDTWSDRRTFEARELRRELLAAVARLGHTLVDLYALAVTEAGSLELGSSHATSAPASSDPSEEPSEGLIEAFLDRLEFLRPSPGLHAHRELASVGCHHDHIVAVNFPEVRNKPVDERRTFFGNALGKQVPIAGMHGRATERAVRHFRMPGYPMVLVTTDVLQEGEDLHSFCSRIVHYGVSWTPSSMEQRTGRIDRIGSQVHRRLEAHEAQPDDDALLQVHFPHLHDTVERGQVRVVLERMNRFMDLMHCGFVPETYSPAIDLAAEALRRERPVPALKERLHTAFPVREEELRAERIPHLSDTLRHAQHIRADLAAFFDETIASLPALPSAHVEWHPKLTDFRVGGTVHIPLADGTSHQRTFELALAPSPWGSETLLECVSEVSHIERKNTERVETAQRELAGVRLSLGDGTTKRDHRVIARSALLFDRDITQPIEVADLIEDVARGAEQAAARLQQDAPARVDRARESEPPADSLADVIDQMTPTPGIALEHHPGDQRFHLHFTPSGRTQTVRYRVLGNMLELDSTACTRATTEERWERHRLGRKLLQWNQASGTAGFRVTPSQRIEAWSAHRVATLQASELRFYVVSLARAADRAEFVLTGRDRF